MNGCARKDWIRARLAKTIFPCFLFMVSRKRSDPFFEATEFFFKNIFVGKAFAHNNGYHGVTI